MKFSSPKRLLPQRLQCETIMTLMRTICTGNVYAVCWMFRIVVINENFL